MSVWVQLVSAGYQLPTWQKKWGAVAVAAALPRRGYLATLQVIRVSGCSYMASHIAFAVSRRPARRSKSRDCEYCSKSFMEW